MALEITVRDLEKQEEISKMVCKCALLSMNEGCEHGDASTIVFAECDTLFIADDPANGEGNRGAEGRP